MEYELIRSRRKTISARVTDGKLTVNAPLNMPLSEIEFFLLSNESRILKMLERSEEVRRKAESDGILSPREIDELAEKALSVIPQKAEYYSKIIGVSYNKITIRNQRTRWGSCSSKGNLNFNCLLMLTPDEVIDAVVVHELCHLKELNHSESFYREVRKAYPEYDKWNGWLRKNGAAIMARMG